MILPHYCKTDAYKERDNFPSLEDIILLRENQDGWNFICDEFLPSVVGIANCERKAVTEEVSKFATVSDIAFIVLTLENNWTYWEGICTLAAKIPEEDVEKRLSYPPTKWTSATVIGGKNTGWSQKGLERFNELCELESANRKSFGEVETEYLKQKQMDATAKQKPRPTTAHTANTVKTYIDLSEFNSVEI